MDEILKKLQELVKFVYEEADFCGTGPVRIGYRLEKEFHQKATELENMIRNSRATHS